MHRSSAPVLQGGHVSNRLAYQRLRAARKRQASISLCRTYDLLRSYLHSLEPGRPLVESELVRALASSRNTVRAALRLLAEEGFVERKAKVGTTARGSTLLPLNSLLTDEDKTSDHQIRTSMETSIMDVPEMVRSWLQIEPGSPVAVIEGMTWHEDEPIGTTVAYVGLTPEQAETYANHNVGVINFLEECLGVEVGESGTRLAAVSCDAETAIRLGIEEGALMLWLEDFIRDTDGRLRAIKQGRLRADRVAFSAIARRPVSAA